METLTNYYKTQLAAFINAEIKKDQTEGCNTSPIKAETEQILSNLYRLTECNDTDIKKRWLPIHLKRMVLYILFDGNAIINTELSQFEPGQFATGTSTITVGEQLIAKASKTISFADVEPFSGYADAKRNVSMIEIAKGSAETNALTKAGIGMDFIGDMRERCYIEESDSENSENNNFNPDIMTKASDLLNEHQKEATSNSAEATKEPDILKAIDGPQKGVPLSELKPKYLAWLLAKIDLNLLDADEAYRETLTNMVLPKYKACYDANVAGFMKSHQNIA